MALSKELVVIEAPTNLGLKTPDSGIVPGVDRLPDWFRRHGLHEKLTSETRVVAVPAPRYRDVLDPETGVRNLDLIATYSLDVARVVGQAVREQRFTLVLGGDCSILLGCSLGLPTTGSYGLFFLDGHTDFAWPGLSQTGAVAGMDLALVTGHGPEKLTNLNNRMPYLTETSVWSVGNRYTHPAYVAAIESSDIEYWSLSRLRGAGIANCVPAFLQRMDEQQAAGFWIHLDVDVLNDTLMPAVDSRQPDGLLYNELVALLSDLLDSGKAVGMDITILDPNLDASGQYVRQFIHELTPIWDRIAR